MFMQLCIVYIYSKTINTVHMFGDIIKYSMITVDMDDGDVGLYYDLEHKYNMGIHTSA